MSEPLIRRAFRCGKGLPKTWVACESAKSQSPSTVFAKSEMRSDAMTKCTAMAM